MNECISIVGLGKLGLPLLAHFVSKGYKVRGVDQNRHLCGSINSGTVPWHEQGMDELLRKHQGSYSAGMDYADAVNESYATFIVVPTPSGPDGSFSNEFVIKAAKEIGKVLKTKKGKHLVVLTSTVMPGTTMDVVKPVLESSSGKKFGQDFGLCYNPEFIALGSVLQDLANPDLVLIGEGDRNSGDILKKIYRHTLGKSVFAVMSPSSAEIAKIAINSYVTQKITFANSLASLCSEFSGASATDVVKALGMDSRIGPKYLNPGLGYGGPCFPRDNIALARFAKNLKLGHLLCAEAVDKVNRSYAGHVASVIGRHVKPEMKVSVLGLAYKPGTAVTIESHGLYIANCLIKFGCKLTVFDEWAAEKDFPLQAIRAKTIKEAIQDADLVVLALKFANTNEIVKSVKREAIIFDCWPQQIQTFSLHESVRYIPLGVGKKF